jgi:hypothetical protein
MTVGLILRVSNGTSIQNLVIFNDQIFFNLLLPPIILASGYELHQANFFRNIGSILTFAFAGTFISAIVLGLILWVYTRIPIDGFSMTFVDAISVGATLSATDPVTILAIFNTYKVDPKLYTVIFGESILNDAVAIVRDRTKIQGGWRCWNSQFPQFDRRYRNFLGRLLRKFGHWSDCGYRNGSGVEIHICQKIPEDRELFDCVDCIC